MTDIKQDIYTSHSSQSAKRKINPHFLNKSKTSSAPLPAAAVAAAAASPTETRSLS